MFIGTNILTPVNEPSYNSPTFYGEVPYTFYETSLPLRSVDLDGK